MTTHRRVLVIGGARSGKSRMARKLAEAAPGERIHIATAQALDEEMRTRIARHREERDGSWKTQEVPIDLANAIRTYASRGKVVLVDCLTLWLSNILLAERDLGDEVDRLVEAVGQSAGPLILVSNEVGQGIVPATPLGRAFQDEQGRLNQQMAEACNAVVLVAAGCPIVLKPAPALSLTLA